jgi:hypothetical protein
MACVASLPSPAAPRSATLIAAAAVPLHSVNDKRVIFTSATYLETPASGALTISLRRLKFIIELAFSNSVTSIFQPI